jgi:uncharacterized protein YprB with RNaseH-like and TPR domain
MNGGTRSRLERLLRSGELRGGTVPAVKIAPSGDSFLFPGEEEVVQTPTGSCYLRELAIPLDSPHGGGILADILNCRGADLALPARDRSLTEIQPGRSLFLDIETTGLSGGTGTWAFLIGLGWLEEENFCLRQYFLRHPAEEKAMLTHFTECAAKFSSIVSFNGKAFDLPMIWTRQILSGLPALTVARYHIDLLPCSRRLWKERLPSCSLRYLEEALLGLHRHDDIPGEEIPAVYFNYLRRGSTARLRDVFQHNVLDILSMVTLLARVARTAAGEEIEHPADRYSLGRLYAEAGRAAEAEQHFRQVTGCGDQRLELEAMLRLSFIYKRRADWDKAVALWKELIRRCCHDLTPSIELAKYYEHRAGDFRAALETAGEALRRAGLRSNITAGEASPSALQHRIARLRHRLGENP